MTDIPLRYARLFHDGQPSYAVLDGRGGARLLGAAPWEGGKPTGAALSAEALAAARLLCPVQPSKIIGIGRNYQKHAAELKNEVPEEPLMFFKPPSSLLAHGGSVVLPPESQRVDYEGELAVVIGRRSRRVTREEARLAVFGYAVACDVTARDLQAKDKQWTRAKGFDTFCPIGPHVVALPDDRGLGLRDGRALALRLRVGDELRQDARTHDMIFDVPTLIAYASQSMTLEPGDVILTGTPEGVGPLAAGDRVTVEIEDVGALTFTVSASA